MIRESRRGLPDDALREVVAGSIALYQRRLSPLKGFSCAHRVLHGGESCSQHAKGLVLDLGPLAAAAPARERLRACKRANEALRAGAHPAKASRAAGRRRRRPRPWFRRWGRRSRDDAEDLFETVESVGDGGDASWCEPSYLECNACDCGLDFGT